MRSYATARSLFGFLEFVFWSVAALGVIGAVAGAEGASRGFGGGAFVGALPGLAIMLFGLLGVASTQNARAGVDSAEYAQQMLKIARDQLEVSKRALKNDQSQPGPSSFSKARGLAAETPDSGYEDSKTVRTELPEKKPEHQLRYINYDCTRMEYRDHFITELKSGHFLVDGVEYSDLDAAKNAIDTRLERA